MINFVHEALKIATQNFYDQKIAESEILHNLKCIPPLCKRMECKNGNAGLHNIAKFGEKYRINFKFKYDNTLNI